MKTLLLLRHGKSSWKYESLPDHERPLSRRGIRDAPRMGRLLAERDLCPDHVVSSTAVRAQTTARLAAEAAGYEGAVDLRDELYMSGPEAYLDVLRALPSEAERVLIVGHNPDLEELLHRLTGADEGLPTAALARVSARIQGWKELGRERGELVSLWRPRDPQVRAD
jgi:phosphohistidine phosphatase